MGLSNGLLLIFLCHILILVHLISCQVCLDGFYGTPCQPCLQCAVGDVCNKDNGFCPNGCQQWWAGRRCHRELVLPSLNPGGITVSDVRTDEFTITWPRIGFEFAPLFYGYTVEYKEAPLRNWTSFEDVAQERDPNNYTRTVTYLTYDTVYDVRVRPYREDRGLREYGAGISATQRTACSTPEKALITNLTVIAPENNRGLERMFISWQIGDVRCTSLKSCTVYYNKSGNSPKPHPCRHPATSATVTFPSQGEYDIFVRIVNNKNLKSFSDTQTLPINNIIPAEFPANTQPSLLAFNSSSITVSWRGIADIPWIDYGYRVDYRTTALLLQDRLWTVVRDEPHIPGRMYSVSAEELNYNTQYTVRVTPYRAYRGENIYYTSVNVTQKTDCIAPEKALLTNLTVLGPDNNRGLERMFISWQVRDVRCTSIKSCSIYYRKPGDSIEIQPCYHPASSVIVNFSTPGDYNVHIRVINNENLMSRSDKRNITINDLIPAEFPSTRQLVLITSNSSSFTVSWRAIENISGTDYGYRVDYRTMALLLQDKPWTVVSDEPHTPGRTYSVTVGGLNYNTQYTVRVTPYRAYRGENIYFTSVNVTEKTNCTEPGTPTVTDLAEIKSHNTSALGRIYITWTIPESSGCDSFKGCLIRYTLVTAELTHTCPPVSGPGVTALDVDDAGEYIVSVEVTNNEDLQSRSSIRSIVLDNKGGIEFLLTLYVAAPVVAALLIVVLVLASVLCKRGKAQSKQNPNTNAVRNEVDGNIRHCAESSPDQLYDSIEVSMSPLETGERVYVNYGVDASRPYEAVSPETRERVFNTYDVLN